MMRVIFARMAVATEHAYNKMINQKRGTAAWIWILILLVIIVAGIGIYLFISGGDIGNLLGGGNSIPQPPALPD